MYLKNKNKKKKQTNPKTLSNSKRVKKKTALEYENERIEEPEMSTMLLKILFNFKNSRGKTNSVGDWEENKYFFTND